VIELWQQGDWKTFCAMLPEYAAKGHGEGFMHDTAMLLGVLGWDHYQGKAEVITPYFPSSGTGQINVVFPVHPVSAEEGDAAYALNLNSLKDPAAVYAAGARRL
jgi:3,4-dihydroxyphenylacetate 2,3-dioxygenase